MLLQQIINCRQERCEFSSKRRFLLDNKGYHIHENKIIRKYITVSNVKDSARQKSKI